MFKIRPLTMFWTLKNSHFEFVSSFDIRISDLCGYTRRNSLWPSKPKFYPACRGVASGEAGSSLGPSTLVEDSLQIRLFLQNKPKVKYVKMNISPFITSIYVNLDTWLSGKNEPKTNPKQTQTKPNSEMPKMNVNIYYIEDYIKKTAFRPKQNKPKQTQFQTQFSNSFIRVPYTLRGLKMSLKSPAEKSGHTRKTEIQD